MLTLKCLNCGLTLLYQGSDADVCPRCLARSQRAVQLIPVSDQVSTRAGHRSIGRLSIDARVRGDRQIVALGGELDIASAPMLEATVAEACAAGVAEVVLDMGSVEFIDSSGLNAIMRGKRLCEAHECVYTLTPAQRPAQGVFEAAGVVERLPFRPAEHERLAPRF